MNALYQIVDLYAHCVATHINCLNSDIKHTCTVKHLLFGGNFYLALLTVKTKISKIGDCKI